MVGERAGFMPTSKEGLCMYISGEYKKQNLDSRPGIQRKNRTLVSQNILSSKASFLGAKTCVS